MEKITFKDILRSIFRAECERSRHIDMFKS